jgi:hypothetical protein
VTIAPVAVPLGLLAGGLAWSRRGYAMRTGAGGLSPTAPVAFDQRQWRHQVRAARARIAAPGAVPLLSRGGEVVAGAVIRTAGHRTAVLAAVPYQRLRSHQVVIGTTGTGKPISGGEYRCQRVSGTQRGHPALSGGQGSTLMHRCCI